jgi:PAS domain S-box-containing protein
MSEFPFVFLSSAFQSRHMVTAALYESVFNSSPTGAYLLSATPEAIILAVNDAFLEAASRKREELVGLSLFDAFPENPDDPNDTGVAALRNSIVRVIATGNSDALPLQRYPIWVITPEGEKRYEERFWSAVNTPIFGGDGELLCIAHRTTDVTKQALAEAALRQSQARYQTLIDRIDQGFCVIEMLYDEHGYPTDYRFCQVNPGFESQTGLHDVVGKTMRELVPDHEQHWFDTYSDVARNGKPIRFENEARQLNRWYDVYAFRVDEANMRRVAILFKDITDDRRAEEALRRSERQAVEAARQAEAERRRLDAVLEAVPVGIVVSDFEGVIQLANQAFRRLWGETHPSPCGIDEFKQFKGRWADGSDKQGRLLQPGEWTTARILRGEEALADIIEIESFDTPPVRRIVLNSGAPVTDGQGKIVGAVVAQMDIADRMKTEEALRQADRRKDEFLAMLAHELRNPLAPIAAAADLLALRGMNELQVKKTSAVIARQVKHMTGLVDDLLDVSRVTRGLVSLDKTRLDAKRIAFEAVEQVRPLIEARGHRLAVHTPPEAAFVRGDQKRLVQVITNLLNNAAKYTPEGGDIVLSMQVEGDNVKTVVADNGIGMAPELVERAFELFAQAERTSDRSQGGLGIGLALVKSLIELHGGTITVYSAGLGKGSRFTVCLPHLKEGPDAFGVEHNHIADLRNAEALKVMVVDDNVDAAQMLAMFVEALGHRVFIEHGSWRAIERAKMETPDVFLLDIGLPDMDGNELARRLRAEPKTANAILVAVTGYGHEHDRNSALDAGFDHHFVKPVDTAALVSLLSGIDKA